MMNMKSSVLIPTTRPRERSDDDDSDNESVSSSVANCNAKDEGWVQYMARAGRKIGLPSRLYDPSTGLAKSYHGAACENYYQSLQELDNGEIEKMES